MRRNISNVESLAPLAVTPLKPARASPSLSYLPRPGFLGQRPAAAIVRPLRDSASLPASVAACGHCEDTSSCTHMSSSAALNELLPAAVPGAAPGTVHVSFKVTQPGSTLYLTSDDSSTCIFSGNVAGCAASSGGTSFPVVLPVNMDAPILPGLSLQCRQAILPAGQAPMAVDDPAAPPTHPLSLLTRASPSLTVYDPSFTATFSLGPAPVVLEPVAAWQCLLQLSLSHNNVNATVKLHGSHDASFELAGREECVEELILAHGTALEVRARPTFSDFTASAPPAALPDVAVRVPAHDLFWQSGSFSFVSVLDGDHGTLTVRLTATHKGHVHSHAIGSPASAAAAECGPVPPAPLPVACCPGSCAAPPASLPAIAMVAGAQDAVFHGVPHLVAGTVVPAELTPSVPPCCCHGAQHLPSPSCTHTCACGAPWSAAKVAERDKAVVFTPLQPVVGLPVYFLPCTRPGCTQTLRYDGSADLLYSVNPRVFFSEALLRAFAERLYVSGGTFNAYAVELENLYRSALGVDAPVPSRALIAEALRGWQSLLSEPHQECPLCGPHPKVLIFDGLATGLRRSLAHHLGTDHLAEVPGIVEDAGGGLQELHFLDGITKANASLLYSFVLPPPASSRGGALPITTAADNGLSDAQLDALVATSSGSKGSCPGLYALHPFLLEARRTAVAVKGRLCCAVPIARLLYPLIAPSVCFVSYQPAATADFLGRLLTGGVVSSPEFDHSRDFMNRVLPFFSDFFRDTASTTLPAYARGAVQHLQKLALTLAAAVPRYLVSLPGSNRKSYSLAELDALAAAAAAAPAAAAAAAAHAPAAAGGHAAPPLTAAAAAAAIRQADAWCWRGSQESVAEDASRGQWCAPGYRYMRGGILAPAMGYNALAFGHTTCEKSAPTTSSHTPGLMTAVCPHKIVYWMSFMRVGEAPREVYNFLRYRCPVPPEIVIYDNACNLARTTARRSLRLAARVRFIVDRLHWRNHVHCSTVFRMFEYGQYCLFLRRLNSQVMEQLNKLLRRIAPHFTHSLPRHAICSLLLFMRYLTRQSLRGRAFTAAALDEVLAVTREVEAARAREEEAAAEEGSVAAEEEEVVFTAEDSEDEED